MTSRARIACHCGKIQESGSLLLSESFPIDCEICHCDTCRYVTGSLGITVCELKRKPSEETFANLTAYHTSEKITRYFCSTCGCKCFIDQHARKKWFVCSGLIEPEVKVPDVVRVLRHWWVLDTRDGGTATRLLKIGGRDVSAYAREHWDEDPMPSEAILNFRDKSGLVPKPDAQDVLEGRCHCGAVRFRLARANYEGHSKEWFVPVEDDTKYFARLCTCRSCRLTLGFSLQPWVYVPPQNIFTVKNEPVTFHTTPSNIDGLQHYQSSETVRRSFCKICGTSVFYQSFERANVIDVSAGTLHASSGAMAQEWLEWDLKTISRKGEAMDNELVGAWLA